MATPNKIIEHLSRVKPNIYSEEDLFHWLCDLDGLVKRVVMQEEDGVHYEFSKDMDSQLLIPPPFEGCYALYLEAMIDFRNKDYDDYDATMQVFDAKFNEFRKAYIREHRPAHSGGFQIF